MNDVMLVTVLKAVEELAHVLGGLTFLEGVVLCYAREEVAAGTVPIGGVSGGITP